MNSFFFHHHHLLLLLLLLLLPFLSSAAPSLSSTSPFTEKAAIIRYWNRKIPNNLPHPSFLVSKLTPLSASAAATFFNLASSDPSLLSSHLSSFCSAAGLLCPTDLSPSLASHPRDSDFTGYLNSNFTNYGTGSADGLSSFQNYSDNQNLALDTFRRYARNAPAHDDKFTFYDHDGNVVTSNFTSYGTNTALGTDDFSAYGEESNLRDLKFTNYDAHAGGRAGIFSQYSENGNGGNDTFSGYGKDANSIVSDFTSYANNTNVFGNTFSHYGEKGTGANDTFSSYGENGNVPVNNFRSYGERGAGANDTFASYSENGNALENTFRSYGKHGTGENDAFASYGVEGNVPVNTFLSYGEKGTGENDTFASYGDNGNDVENVFRSYSKGKTGGEDKFTSYRNQSNIGDDFFTSYRKGGNGGAADFTNYGHSVNPGSDNFKGYAEGSPDDQIRFKEYFAVNTSFKAYANISNVDFKGYHNSSSSTLSTAAANQKQAAAKRWVEPGKFFRERSLRKGTVMPMPDIRDRMAPRSFLPRSIASKIPFSAAAVDGIFRILPETALGKAVESTMADCERAPSRGETKRCAASAEDMIDFAVAVLGNDIEVRSTASTNGSNGDILIGDVRGVNGGKVTESVSCHQSLFPYLVYYCHSVPRVRVYVADILAVDSKEKINQGVAICHIDTSDWGPIHGAFVALGPGPGKIEVCHWIFEGDMTWTVADHA